MMPSLRSSSPSMIPPATLPAPQSSPSSSSGADFLRRFDARVAAITVRPDEELFDVSRAAPGAKEAHRRREELVRALRTNRGGLEPWNPNVLRAMGAGDGSATAVAALRRCVGTESGAAGQSAHGSRGARRTARGQRVSVAEAQTTASLSRRGSIASAAEQERKGPGRDTERDPAGRGGRRLVGKQPQKPGPGLPRPASAAVAGERDGPGRKVVRAADRAAPVARRPATSRPTGSGAPTPANSFFAQRATSAGVARSARTHRDSSAGSAAGSSARDRVPPRSSSRSSSRSGSRPGSRLSSSRRSSRPPSTLPTHGQSTPAAAAAAEEGAPPVSLPPSLWMAPEERTARDAEIAAAWLREHVPAIAEIGGPAASFGLASAATLSQARPRQIVASVGDRSSAFAAVVDGCLEADPPADWIAAADAPPALRRGDVLSFTPGKGEFVFCETWRASAAGATIVSVPSAAMDRAVRTETARRHATAAALAREFDARSGARGLLDAADAVALGSVLRAEDYARGDEIPLAPGRLVILVAGEACVSRDIPRAIPTTTEDLHALLESLSSEATSRRAAASSITVGKATAPCFVNAHSFIVGDGADEDSGVASAVVDRATREAARAARDASTVRCASKECTALILDTAAIGATVEDALALLPQSWAALAASGLRRDETMTDDDVLAFAAERKAKRAWNREKGKVLAKALSGARTIGDRARRSSLARVPHSGTARWDG